MFELQLHPEEKQLLPYRGMPVCLIMKDGSRKIGQLTACRGGKIILNGNAEDDREAAVTRKTAARRAKRPRARKPAGTFAPRQGLENPEWDDFGGGFFDGQPPFASTPREKVPLNAVESVLVL